MDQGPAPLEGSPDRIAHRLREFAEAGAAEAIAILSPITEASILSFGEVLEALRD